MAPPHGIWINEAESRRKVTTTWRAAAESLLLRPKVCKPVSNLKQDGHMETGSAQSEYNLLLEDVQVLFENVLPSHIFRDVFFANHSNQCQHAMT